MYEKEILILIAASALVIYLTVTQDGEYVPIKERPKRKTFARNVINYYGWRGPFFIDDFAKFENDAMEVIDKRKAVPLGFEETNFREPETFQGETQGETQENFTAFCGPENPFNEVVPVRRPNPYLDDCKDGKPCSVPKYNRNNQDYKKCHSFAKWKCRVPTYNAEHGWRNEYWNSTYKMTGPSDEGSLCRPPNWRAGDPGNYRQSTNNNLDAPNNLKCQARSRYMDYCRPQDKVSPVCYATVLNDCMGNKQ